MNKSLCKAEELRLLVTMPWGIGDTIAIGLSAVDQVVHNDPRGHATVDVLCTHSQAPIFAHDPRIHAVISVDESLFPTAAHGTWKRGLRLPPETVELARQLHHQDYTAVLPFLFAPTFFYLLHLPIIFLNVQESWNVVASLHSPQAIPLQTVIRSIINKCFQEKAAPCVDEPIPLYLAPAEIQRARYRAALVKKRAGLPWNYRPWLLVAPDTSSVITRPPTALLAQGLAGALRSDPRLFVSILPSYTDAQATRKLWRALAPHFSGRVSLIPAEPPMSFLELAAFIDQSDIFLTGDTCTMHLAVASKTLPASLCTDVFPRNTVKIIALFGGTHPGFHGYSQRTTIIGEGRKEQSAIAPGLYKEMCHRTEKNFFDHISPQQITNAILSQATP